MRFRMDLSSNCRIFLEGGDHLGCVFPPRQAVIDTVGEAEDEASCDEREKGKGIGNRRARLRREG